MAGLLWYFPTSGEAVDPRLLRHAAPDWFAAVGLADLIVEGDAVPNGINTQAEHGPDGGCGRLAFWDDRPEDAPTPYTIDVKRQTWYEAPRRGELKRGRFWVGYWNERPPSPADLERKRLLDGQLVPLGSGSWLVPTARQLPKAFGLDQDGEPEWRFKFARHEAFYDEARRLIEAIRAEFRTTQRLRYDWNEQLSLTATALAFNYRVTLEVLDLLKVIDNETVWLPAYVAAGIPLDEADAKKDEATTAAGA